MHCNLRHYFTLMLKILLLSSLSFVAAADRVIVKLGTIAPEGSAWHDALLQLRQEWREISNGDVEMRIYAGGVLGGESEMVRKIQRRSLDAVAISASGLPYIDSSVNCLNLPLLFESYDELDKVRSQIAPELEKRFEKKHFKILNWAEAGWVYFFTKQPVKTPAELRKLRLWTAAGLPEYEKLFKQFGFQVVPLPATEMLTALQTGLIEAIDVPPLFALLDRSYQHANYMIDINWAPLNAATVISMHTWQRIPEQYRPRLLRAVQQAGEELRIRTRKSEEDAVKEMEKRGLHVVKLDEASRSQWYKEAKQAYPELRGTLVEDALFDRVMQLHEEFLAEQAR